MGGRPGRGKFKVSKEDGLESRAELLCTSGQMDRAAWGGEVFSGCRGLA